LGNDALLSLIHEARMQLLAGWGFTELDAGGNSLIMGDVMIAYKKESYYGDVLTISLWAEEITDKNFDLLYKVEIISAETAYDIAYAKTGMVCFDYTIRKIASMKTSLKGKLKGAEN